MTTLELSLPLPGFFGGHLGNPETISEGARPAMTALEQSGMRGVNGWYTE